jgi:hypothetical protein
MPVAPLEVYILYEADRTDENYIRSLQHEVEERGSAVKAYYWQKHMAPAVELYRRAVALKENVFKGHAFTIFPVVLFVRSGILLGGCSSPTPLVLGNNLNKYLNG